MRNKASIAKGEDHVCNAVYWRDLFINDDFPGMCFGFTTHNSSNTFVTQTEAIVMGRRGLIRPFRQDLLRIEVAGWMGGVQVVKE